MRIVQTLQDAAFSNFSMPAAFVVGNTEKLEPKCQTTVKYVCIDHVTENRVSNYLPY